MENRRAVEPAERPGELFRALTDVALYARRARAAVVRLVGFCVVVVLGAALVAAAGPIGWVVVGIGVLGVVVYGIGVFDAGNSSRWDGEDLINLIVVPSGIVVKAGLAIDWSEIAYVRVIGTEYSRSGMSTSLAVATGNSGIAVAKMISGDIGKASGNDQARVYFHLRDFAGTRSRATARQRSWRRSVLWELADGEGYGTAGYASAVLGHPTAEQLPPLVDLLARECAARQIPFTAERYYVG